MNKNADNNQNSNSSVNYDTWAFKNLVKKKTPESRNLATPMCKQGGGTGATPKTKYSSKLTDVPSSTPGDRIKSKTSGCPRTKMPTKTKTSTQTSTTTPGHTRTQ